MRVLHVLDSSLPRVAGYSSRTKAILENQAALGFEPVAATGLRQPPSALDQEMIGGVLHHRTRAPAAFARLEGASGAREIAEMAILGRRLYDIAHGAGFDLFHAHSPLLCGVPARAVSSRLDLPCVYEIRAFWEDAAVDQGKGSEHSLRYAAIRALETRLCRGMDAVVALCEGIRRELVSRGLPEERIFVVPNGVDVERFVPRPRDEALAARFGLQGKIVIAYIGTLFRFEGAQMLLEALSRITRERSDVRGLIVGYGEAEEALRSEHARLGLGDRVVITGKVEPSEVAGFYTLADVLCYPREQRRITELTTPLKPLEAMSMGKAVVASDVGGLSELIDDGATGLLFHAGDVEDLTNTLLLITRDAILRRRMGEEARAHVVTNRSWRVIAARYREVYEAARAQHARRKSARPAQAA